VQCALFLSAAALGFAQPPTSGSEGASFHTKPRVSIVPRVRPSEKPDAAIRAESTLVLIPVTVTNPIGGPILGLNTESFHLFEDGVEQRITHFANEDTSVSVGLVFDASTSMNKKIHKSRDAVTRLFRSAEFGDEYSLVAFNDRPQLLSKFTPDTKVMQDTLLKIVPRGWTALYDAIAVSLHEMKTATKPRKALVIISDGGDNNSRYTRQEIKNLIRESDTCIFAIGILGPRVAGNATLSELAEESGGRMFPVDDLNDLPEAIAMINRALHNQYVLGYSPTNQEKDGKYRKVRVDLLQVQNQPKMRASWRMGYYAPF
jgi:Ca-activated chloride channel homolog